MRVGLRHGRFYLLGVGYVQFQRQHVGTVLFGQVGEAGQLARRGGHLIAALQGGLRPDAGAKAAGRRP